MKLTFDKNVKADSAREIRKMIIDELPERDTYLYSSPVGNCQTFSIAYVYKLLGLSNESIKLLLRKIYEDVCRKQLLIDVKLEVSDKAIEVFTPFSTNIISTPYKSTNGSRMVMHIIQLDVTKIF